MYYAYRLFILSGSWLLVGVVCIVRKLVQNYYTSSDTNALIQIAFMQATAGIVAGVQAFFIGNFTGLASKAFASEPVRELYVLPDDEMLTVASGRSGLQEAPLATSS